jgi:hypothetical protein
MSPPSWSSDPEGESGVAGGGFGEGGGAGGDGSGAGGGVGFRRAAMVAALRMTTFPEVKAAAVRASTAATLLLSGVDSTIWS